MGSNGAKNLGNLRAIPKSYFQSYEFTSQFEGAERIASKWGISRVVVDEFAVRSQALAARGWDADLPSLAKSSLLPLRY